MTASLGSAIRSKGKLCYRCGAPANSREHVVPKGLYPPKPEAQLLTVPSCRDCNNSAAMDEEYFRLVLCASWINSPKAKAVWDEKARPSLDREEYDGLRKAVVADLRELYLPVSGGGFAAAGIYKGNVERMDRVAEKIVRGLYFHVTGRRLLDEARFRFHWQPKDWLRDMALRAQLINVDPDIFSCRYAITSDPKDEVSIWWMLFYKSFMYVVTVDARRARES